jgi:hypothetical protein
VDETTKRHLASAGMAVIGALVALLILWRLADGQPVPPIGPPLVGVLGAVVAVVALQRSRQG